MIRSISIYRLKPAFQKSLEPVLRRFVSAGVTPNAVTLGTCVACALYGAVLATNAVGELPARVLFLYPFVQLLRMALNALDGMLANRLSLQSTRGAFLNEVCDVVADLALTLPFIAWVSPNLEMLLAAIILVSLLAEFVGLSAVVAGVKRNFLGPFGKSDRAAYFSVLAILIAIHSSESVVQTTMLVGIALGLMTLVNRTLAIWRGTNT
jgi:CDP-diacylglycerol--glycerol-3-phosphate 3-phosphatidyltransferase